MNGSQEKPLISVIVTTYNRKELLKETIDSILNQTFRNFELIVVDNFSDYDFFSHIESFNDKRLIPFQNQNNGIIAVNRNFGIQKAKGQYIAFCDDDDLWLPNKLEEQLKHFDDESIIGVGSRTVQFNKRGLIKERKITKKNIDLGFRDIMLDVSIPLSSLIVRNSGFLFSEKVEFITAEDWDYQLNMTLNIKKKLRLLSDSLILYRTHDHNSIMKTEYVFNLFNVLTKYQSHISNKIVKEVKFRRYYSLGKLNFKNKEFNLSKKYFFCAFKTFSFYKPLKFSKCILYLIIVYFKLLF